MASTNPLEVLAGVTAPQSGSGPREILLRQLFRNLPLDLNAPVPTLPRGIAWPGQEPFLYFPPPTIPGGGASLTFKVGPGTLWLQVNRFFTNASASNFAGLRITSALIHYNQEILLNGSSDISLNTTFPSPLIVSCNVAPPSTPLDPSVEVQLPTTVTFVIPQSGLATIGHIGEATASIYSKTINLTPLTAPSASVGVAGPLDGILLQFPFAFDQTSLSIIDDNNIAHLRTALDSPASINGAFWGLNIVDAPSSNNISRPATLGSKVIESTTIVLQLGQGVLGSFLGTSISCGPFLQICLNPVSGVVMVGSGGKFLNPGPYFTLWNRRSTVKLDQSLTLNNSQTEINWDSWDSKFVYSHQSTFERLMLGGLLTANLDQPRDVNNARTSFAAVGYAAISTDLSGGNETSVELLAFGNSDRAITLKGYAMKNLLVLQGDADQLDATAILDKTSSSPFKLKSGALKLTASIRSVLPFLPDPYATNIALQTPPKFSVGTSETDINWPGTTESSSTIDISLPQIYFQNLNLLPATPEGQPEDGSIPPLTPADQSILLEIKDVFGFSTGTQRWTSQLLGQGATMLDLSTNTSQFGVSLVTKLPPEDLIISPNPFVIKNLLLQAPASMVGVMTLPAVSWEPINTDSTTNTDDFPSELDFPDSGPTTVFGQKQVTLIPVTPRYAIDSLVTNYNASNGIDRTVAVRFTLPNGMVATAKLEKDFLFPIPLPNMRVPTLIQVQPSFVDSSQKPPLNLQGGDQLSIRPAQGFLILPLAPHPDAQDQVSPSFSGTTYQLHNGSGGLSRNLSALDAVDGTFNGEFGPNSSTARVPITRADFSGWGESLFSDWRDPSAFTASVPSISKAQFEVAVGRSISEVVQAVNDSIPFGVRIVTTTTIQRLNSGIVMRKTDWKAASDGLFKFMDPSIVTHPGVILGAINIVNVRDTGERLTVTDGYGFAGVTYDCTVLVENCVAGQVAQGVPCTNILGYVQISSPGANTAFGIDEYAGLLDLVGPKIGASIDCSLNIGLSGQIMHIGRFIPGYSVRDTGINDTFVKEFIMVASGSLVLKGGSGAQWSFVRRLRLDHAFQAVDAVSGVPLIRLGPVSSATNPPVPLTTPQPYRFSEALDMFTPDKPDLTYALVHATGSQRVAFRLPKIEVDGLNRITSQVPALLADMFALGTSMGPFPAESTCIDLGVTYYLQILPDGNLKLNMDPLTLPLDSSTRSFIQSENCTNFVYASRTKPDWQKAKDDSPQQQSTVTLIIDTTSATTPWSLSITFLTYATVIADMGEMYDIVGSIESDPQTPTNFAETNLVFGPGLDPVQKVFELLHRFGPLPPLLVHMTNSFHLSLILGVNLGQLLEFLGPPLSLILPQLVDELSVSLGVSTDFKHVSGVLEIDATLSFPAGAYTVFLLFKFAAELGSDGIAIELDAGGAFGEKWDFKPWFEAHMYVGLTLDLDIGHKPIGVGGSILAQGMVRLLSCLGAQIGLEAKYMSDRFDCTQNGQQQSTLWSYAQFTLAISVNLWFVTIDVHAQFEKDWDHTQPQQANPCKLIHA